MKTSVFTRLQKVRIPLKKLSLLCLLLSMTILCCSCKEASGLTTVRLNEVAHSIFYAPQYAAIELGYFEEEGIKLELTNGSGADKTMTALLSGEADIGFMGSEASIYIYNEGNPDYAVNFAQLTQRAGFPMEQSKRQNRAWRSRRRYAANGL